MAIAGQGDRSVSRVSVAMGVRMRVAQLQSDRIFGLLDGRVPPTTGCARMTEPNAKCQWKLRAPVVAATLAALVAAGALAQGTPVGGQTTTPNGTGLLRGVAVDSVHGMSAAGAERPLVGAEGVPGLRLASAGDGRLHLVGSQMSGCVRYLVDGHEFPTYSPDDADTFIRPSEIGGVEVYEPGEVPADLAVGPGTASCTIAVIWTKAYLGVY